MSNETYVYIVKSQIEKNIFPYFSAQLLNIKTILFPFSVMIYRRFIQNVEIKAIGDYHLVHKVRFVPCVIETFK